MGPKRTHEAVKPTFWDVELHIRLAHELTFTTVNNLTVIFFFPLGGAIIPMRFVRECGVLVPAKCSFVTTCADRIS